MNEKYNLLNNFLHNELGLYREDIRDMLKEAIKKEARLLVKNTFDKFSVNKTASDIWYSKVFFGDAIINDQIVKEIVNLLKDKIEVKLKSNTEC